MGNSVYVLEMDGGFVNTHELVYVESYLSNTATKFFGELTHRMVQSSESPGSDNGTGFFQTLVALKIREFYEKTLKATVYTPGDQDFATGFNSPPSSPSPPIPQVIIEARNPNL